jgi:hypothetical protein
MGELQNRSVGGQQNNLTMAAALEGKAASGFAKLSADFSFEDLPAERSAPLWTEIRTEYSLTLAELSALQNARCQQGNKKKFISS